MPSKREANTTEIKVIRSKKYLKKVLDNLNGLMYNIRVAAERTKAQEYSG